jgi:hypothetical protein
MADLTTLAQPAVEELEDKEEDQLYAEIGRRLRMIQLDPKTAADFQPPPDIRQKVEIETLGMVDDMSKIGRRFFDRVNVQAYDLVCGSNPDDLSERQSLLNALGLGKDAAGPVLAALLVSHLALAPIIASVVAALAIRLFFNPVHQQMCDVWKSKLPAG